MRQRFPPRLLHHHEGRAVELLCLFGQIPHPAVLRLRSQLDADRAVSVRFVVILQQEGAVLFLGRQFHLQLQRRQRFLERFEILSVGEVRLGVDDKGGVGQQLHNPWIGQPPLQLQEKLLQFVKHHQELP